MNAPQPRPFTIAVPDEDVVDLRRRPAATRWPQPIPGDTWELGTEEVTLRRLATRWADGYDWRAQERALNALPHFVVDLDGADVHYGHLRGAGDAAAFPLVLTHGRPAYQHQQQTRPVTLAYGLSDSPAGMLGWLVEKYRAWSDSHGDLSSRFGDDDVLTCVARYTVMPRGGHFAAWEEPDLLADDLTAFFGMFR